MKLYRFTAILLIILTVISCNKTKYVEIITSGQSSERVNFGAKKLQASLSEAGYEVSIKKGDKSDQSRFSIYVGESGDAGFRKMLPSNGDELNTTGKQEGFLIQSSKNSIIITGDDGSGALYGCIELVQRIRDKGKIPEKINLSDHPEMVMSGTCVGLQKTGSINYTCGTAIRLPLL